MNRTASVTTLSPLATRTDAEIEAVLDAAFGTDRHGRTAYAIRQGCAWLRDFSYAVSDETDLLLGVLQSWPVELRRDDGEAATPLIMVGPVAILPERQGGGFGRMLMDRLCTDADAKADASLMMIGDPEYYGRFWGFSAERTAGWRTPGPVEARRLLMRDVPGAAPLAGLHGMLAPRSGDR